MLHPPRAMNVRRMAATCAVVLVSLAACTAAAHHRDPASPSTHSSQTSVGQLGPGDGYIPDGQSLSPFDSKLPAVVNLDPTLRAAIQHAATDAAADGVTMVMNSGWRSKRYQQSLLDAAITTYGSRLEARKFVNTPAKSTHVRGKAVDVGPTDADSWLSQHGAAYGLCQIYGNEMWHYEVAVRPGGTCPAPISDASAG